MNGGTPAVLLALDDPATPAASRLFADDYFHSEKARVPVSFQISTGGEIGAAKGPAVVTIDAGKTDDHRGNTAQAAAFHALKYARFTHDAVALLKGDHKNLPQLHEFRLRYTTDAAAAPTPPSRSPIRAVRPAATPGWPPPGRGSVLLPWCTSTVTPSSPGSARR